VRAPLRATVQQKRLRAHRNPKGTHIILGPQTAISILPRRERAHRRLRTPNGRTICVCKTKANPKDMKNLSGDHGRGFRFRSARARADVGAPRARDGATERGAAAFAVLGARRRCGACVLSSSRYALVENTIKKTNNSTCESQIYKWLFTRNSFYMYILNIFRRWLRKCQIYI
jgi:hypothetical protein